MLVVPRGWDEDADAARARAALYGLRSVDRRFFLGTSPFSRPAGRIVDDKLTPVITSILRTRLLPAYAGRVTESSDPIGAGSGDPTAESVFAHRTREGAVLDRFLAVRTGFEQRRAESALSEDGGDEDHIFAFLQVSLHLQAVWHVVVADTSPPPVLRISCSTFPSASSRRALMRLSRTPSHSRIPMSVSGYRVVGCRSTSTTLLSEDGVLAAHSLQRSRGNPRRRRRSRGSAPCSRQSGLDASHGDQRGLNESRKT